jgi:hypothetical protein
MPGGGDAMAAATHLRSASSATSPAAAPHAATSAVAMRQEERGARAAADVTGLLRIQNHRARPPPRTLAPPGRLAFRPRWRP